MSVFAKFGAALALVGASAFGFQTVTATTGGSCCCGENCMCETCDCDGTTCSKCECPNCGCTDCGCGDSCPAQK